jgi:hypothetical protein
MNLPAMNASSWRCRPHIAVARKASREDGSNDQVRCFCSAVFRTAGPTPCASMKLRADASNRRRSMTLQIVWQWVCYTRLRNRRKNRAMTPEGAIEMLRNLDKMGTWLRYREVFNAYLGA